MVLWQQPFKFTSTVNKLVTCRWSSSGHIPGRPCSSDGIFTSGKYSRGTDNTDVRSLGYLLRLLLSVCKPAICLFPPPGGLMCDWKHRTTRQICMKMFQLAFVLHTYTHRYNLDNDLETLKSANCLIKVWNDTINESRHDLILSQNMIWFCKRFYIWH